MVSAWGAAAHRRPHAGRGAPADPPASAARSRPAPDGSGACPPGSLRLVLRLTAPRASPTRLRPLPWKGPRRRRLLRLTSPRTRRVAGETWPSGVRVSPARPAVAQVPHPMPWPRPARSHASRYDHARWASTCARTYNHPLFKRLNQSPLAPRCRRTASAGNLPGRRTAARWRGWAEAPGGAGRLGPLASAPAGRVALGMRADPSSSGRVAREYGQGAWSGVGARGRWKKPFEIPILPRVTARGRPQFTSAQWRPPGAASAGRQTAAAGPARLG